MDKVFAIKTKQRVNVDKNENTNKITNESETEKAVRTYLRTKDGVRFPFLFSIVFSPAAPIIRRAAFAM